MIERAGVDVHPLYSFAPRTMYRFGEQPAAMTLSRELRNEADEGKLALVRLAEVELQDADLSSTLVDDGVELDFRVLNDRREVRIVHDQPREPQPGAADEPEQRTILLRLRNLDALQRERRFGNLLVRWRAPA